MELTINTTQNVPVNFTAASIGDRLLAQIIDMLIKIAYLIVVFYGITFFSIDSLFNHLDQWSIIGIYVIIALPFIFYSLVQESLWEGKTMGKKIMKIKVIKLDGYQAGFGDYLIRWLFRLVEISLGNGVIALISILISKKNQRLGDIAAGTAVISLKQKININHTILEEVTENYTPTYPLVIKLSDNDIRIIKETFEKSVTAKDYKTIVKLKEKISSVTGIVNQSANNQDFIKTILKDYSYYTGK